ncbi:sensor histidine kinase [Microbacterium sp. A204]|uniref:sensor histidine kinase n=1 Tax=Microbacterium sp. A204 TaxID=3457321 RepID=UPI003FD212F1
MNTGRSSSVLMDTELRLPRTPGVIRRFWARHPLLADVLIALICFLMNTGPLTFIGFYSASDHMDEPVPPVPVPIIIGAMILIACGLMLRRRRWPVIVFIAAYAVSIAYLFSLSPAGGVLLLVASYSLAVYRSTRAAWTGLAYGMGGYALIALVMWLTGVLTLQSTLNGVAGELTMALIGTLIGVNIGGRKRYVEAIIARSRQLLIERDQQGRIAAATERARIAREMHDIVSHSLTVVVALSEGAAATDDHERARDASAAAAATARGALTEMRAMLGVLRDGDADAPLAPSAPVSPQDTVAAAQRAGYPATLTVKGAGAGSPAASPAVEFAIGRIVQEGMTNAMRHARGARTISVRIAYEPELVTIDIENDGVSGTAGTSGFGIRGLQERAAHVGGTLTSAPVSENRWLLHAELHADASETEEHHE